MPKIKVLNSSANLEMGDIFIPTGESILEEQDWQQFKNATIGDPNSFPALALRTGSIRAEPVGAPLPDFATMSDPFAIADVLNQITDQKELKSLMLKMHQSPSLWRQRNLISARFGELGLSPSWSKAEIAHLDQICPSRMSDAYRNPYAPDLDPNRGDVALERLMRRETEKAAVIARHRQELAELGID